MNKSNSKYHSQNSENRGMNYFTLKKEQLIKILGDKEFIISDPKWDNENYNKECFKK